jgi:zinc/manganese transport system permease protein
MLEISLDPEGAVRADRRIVLWDVVFYATFATVVTSSVRIAGVLLVFCYLVVPAAMAAMLARGVGARLGLGWALGAAVSLAGLAASWHWDLPTGATIVSAFGAAIGLAAALFGLVRAARAVRARGAMALAPAGLVAGALIALAGVLLASLPRMDHPWLDALEDVAPVVQETFLTQGERAARRDALEAIGRGEADLARMRALAQEVRWGVRSMDAENEERLRQFIAGRSEIVAGDQLVLRTLRAKARERQRYWLGIPIVLLGALLLLALRRAASRRRAKPGQLSG